MKILLVQLGANGDCLFVTTIAKQIKEKDYPNCHLSWMILDRCKQVIENNPYIDEIIPIEETGINEARLKIGEYIEELKSQGKFFDKIIITDNYETNEKIWFGPLRSMYHRVYQELSGNKLIISPEPVIFLKDSEVQNVDKFVKKHKLNEQNCFPILFECMPQSGQSTMNVEKALDIAYIITKKYPHVKIILSSKDRVESNNKNIVDGSELSYRENAQLINHCKLLVGVSSGITWLNTSNWSNKIPMIAYIKRYEDYYPTFSASILLDFKNLGESTDNLIELYCTPDDNNLIDCISNVVENSFQHAKHNFPLEDISPVEYLGKMYMAKNVLKQTIEPVDEEYKVKMYLLGCIPITATVKKYNYKQKISFCGIPILKLKGNKGV